MFFALIAALALAQDGPVAEWEPVVEVRPRFSSGFTEGIALGFLNRPAVTHRARLGLNFERGIVETQVVAQLASGWERGPARYRFVPADVDFYEGWGKIDGELPAKIRVALTAGRMSFDVHDGRLISRDDFSWDGQFIDGLRLDGSVGVFHASTVTYRALDENPARFRGAVLNWFGVGASNPLTEWVIDFVTVNDYRLEMPRVTVGPFLSVRSGRWHVQSEAYAQTVAPELLAPVTETSVLASQLLGFTAGPERLVVLKVRGDVFTGNLQGPGAGFTAPLGDSYRYFGHLGMFQTSQAAGNRGAADLAFLSSLSPTTRLELEGDLHLLWFTDGVGAGQELDGTVRFHVSPYARLEVGLAAMLPTRETRSRYGLRRVEHSEYFQLEVGAPPR